MLTPLRLSTSLPPAPRPWLDRQMQRQFPRGSAGLAQTYTGYEDKIPCPPADLYAIRLRWRLPAAHPPVCGAHRNGMAGIPTQHLEVDHPVLDVIRDRWSPAVYAAQTVEPDKLLSILEAARWAPSSYNAQPWSFLVARKEEPEDFARMLSCLVPGNVAWAKHVPVLMISVAKLQSEHGGAGNRYAVHDTGIATGFLMLQAASLGIMAHGMAGFDAAKARELYGIPESHEAVAAIGLGYPGDPQAAPEELRKRNQRKPRRALDQFVFAGQWGHPLPLL
jgi:nitroreductase